VWEGPGSTMSCPPPARCRVLPAVCPAAHACNTLSCVSGVGGGGWGYITVMQRTQLYCRAAVRKEQRCYVNMSREYANAKVQEGKVPPAFTLRAIGVAAIHHAIPAVRPPTSGRGVVWRWMRAGASVRRSAWQVPPLFYPSLARSAAATHGENVALIDSWNATPNVATFVHDGEVLLPACYCCC